MLRMLPPQTFPPETLSLDALVPHNHLVRKIDAQFVLRAADLVNVKKNLKVLHPLPRIDEITVDVDKTPYAYYFQQAGNGIYARQALLSLVLNENVVID